MNLLNFAAIGLGAALGAWSRWLLGLALNSWCAALPLGTLAANLIGGYLAGLAVGIFHDQTGISPTLRLFVLTGFLGGLTTFSTFSVETVERFQNGTHTNAIALLALHLVGSLTMTWLGFLSANALRN
ncbi:MAG: fluoride efflux transporter CrcB [Zoogloeaceae bacterium]|jgi:CrcB protein|nr:fluoride efflux transporter CrcB [Zoogloeaceae bacterium]